MVWEQELAEVYDAVAAGDFNAAILDPMVERLADLAHGGPVRRRPGPAPDARA